MDVTHGLLDTLCNPRTSFHTLRCLNTILNSPVHATTFTDPREQIRENNRILYLNNTHRRLALVLSSRDIFALNALDFHSTPALFASIIYAREKPKQYLATRKSKYGMARPSW